MRLALETSTRLGSLAIGEDGRLIAECNLSVRAVHSETVLPEVERMLRRAGAAPGDLEAVVVGAGPGSFTGVRIAAALAKGLRFALDRPLFAYSSLAAVAGGIGPAGVWALFDARRGEVYAAAYRIEDDPAPVAGPMVSSIEAVLGSIDDPRAWRFAGEGAIRHAERLREAGATVLPPHLGIPRASSLLWLADRWPEAGRVLDPTRWEPSYVRASGAERQGPRDVARA
ncbi:MAG: tRNA (adenosine(37)-N6)-threonylcarbamoyltransferase complex dimerization subunit type 1 TsaB, partial [Gemmatimonadota bacterium]